MSCDRFQQRLSLLIDGDLTAAERLAVEEHLRACVPCRRLYRDLESLGRRARELDPEVRPDRDLWPEIVQRIGGEPSAREAPRDRRGSLRRWGLAAAATLLIGLAVPMAVQWLGAPGGDEARRAEREEDRSAYQTLLRQADLARVEDGTLQPRRDLEELLAAQRGHLDAATVATFEVEADRLQRAIGEIHLALEDQPENRQLRLMLADRYRQERDLLQRVSRV